MEGSSVFQQFAEVCKKGDPTSIGGFNYLPFNYKERFTKVLVFRLSTKTVLLSHLDGSPLPKTVVMGVVSRI